MRKALVPGVVLIVLAFFGALGITGDTTVEDAITLIVTGALVYLVPNKRA